LTPTQQGSNGYRIAASVCCTSKNALGTEKGRKLPKGKPLARANR
jgi:hypothetical protein